MNRITIDCTENVEKVPLKKDLIFGSESSMIVIGGVPFYSDGVDTVRMNGSPLFCNNNTKECWHHCATSKLARRACI